MRRRLQLPVVRSEVAASKSDRVSWRKRVRRTRQMAGKLTGHPENRCRQRRRAALKGRFAHFSIQTAYRLEPEDDGSWPTIADHDRSSLLGICEKSGRGERI